MFNPNLFKKVFFLFVLLSFVTACTFSQELSSESNNIISTPPAVTQNEEEVSSFFPSLTIASISKPLWDYSLTEIKEAETHQLIDETENTLLYSTDEILGIPMNCLYRFDNEGKLFHLEYSTPSELEPLVSTETDKQLNYIETYQMVSQYYDIIFLMNGGVGVENYSWADEAIETTNPEEQSESVQQGELTITKIYASNSESAVLELSTNDAGNVQMDIFITTISSSSDKSEKESQESSVKDNDKYGNVKLGMSKNDVIKAEAKSLYKEDVDSLSYDSLLYWDYQWNISYTFTQNKLSKITGVRIYSSSSSCVEDYLSVRSKMEDVFGILPVHNNFFNSQNHPFYSSDSLNNQIIQNNIDQIDTLWLQGDIASNLVILSQDGLYALGFVIGEV